MLIGDVNSNESDSGIEKITKEQKGCEKQGKINLTALHLMH